MSISHKRKLCLGLAAADAHRRAGGAIVSRFSRGALENIEETGVDPLADAADLRSGAHTSESLLAKCLRGADDDRAEGWRDYVSALAAEVTS